MWAVADGFRAATSYAVAHGLDGRLGRSLAAGPTTKALEIAMISLMTTPRPNPYKVMLLTSDRPASTGGQSPLIRRYRLARLRPDNRPLALSNRVEQAKRIM